MKELKVSKEGQANHYAKHEQPEGVWYQAETVDPQDAAKEIELWVPALTEEYVGLTNQYRAIKPIDKSEVSQQDIDDGLVEVLPAKVVCTRKPPFGQRRARIVACGSFGAAGNRDYENPITGERFAVFRVEGSTSVGRPTALVYLFNRYQQSIFACSVIAAQVW